MEEQINTAADQAQTQAKAMLADMGARTQGAVEKTSRMFEELGEFNKGNLEALVESGRIMARGVESLSQDAVASAKRSYEGQLAAFRALATAKSPTEFMKVQGDLVRQGFDAMVAATSRNTETTLKLAGEIAQPIQNRMALAAAKVRTAA